MNRSFELMPATFTPQNPVDHPPRPLLKGAFFVKNDHIYEKVAISDILWIEAYGAYCKIITLHKEILLCINLSSFQKSVTSPSIIRVHRSYIVNTNQIDAFETNFIHINRQLIPVGPKYKNCLAKVFPYIEKTGIIIL